MPTPYLVIYDRVISKIKDYNFLKLDEDDVYAILSSYLPSSISHFHVCKNDLTKDDLLEEFNATLNNDEIEILSNYMVIEYLDSNYIRVPLVLKSQLTSKDFNAFSPANHLEKVMNVRNKYLVDNETLLTRYAWKNNKDNEN